MSRSQVQSGHAFEYGIACAFNRQYGSSVLLDDEFTQRAKTAFTNCDDEEQEKIFRASDQIAAFLITSDNNLRPRDGYAIRLQSDMKGKDGDVRDVLISNSGLEIGISAKNRHTAVKHSRLSDTNDFGNIWFGTPCHPEYFEQIGPMFCELRTLERQEALWRNLENKAKRFYIPILDAFKDEVERSCKDISNTPKLLVEYLLGKCDFYKIVKKNGDVTIESFNLHGTLDWGVDVKLPTRMIEARLKDNSENTMILTFDNGWQLSFRIHNAESRVIPSLKFDVQIIGSPDKSQQHIHYMGEAGCHN